MAIPERETYYISRVEAILENILGANNVIVPPESLIEELLQCWLYGEPFTETVVTDARNVKALISIVNNETYDEEPTSEIEALLKAIANGEDPDPAFLPPKSRNGKLLLEIFNNRLPDEFQRVEWIESPSVSFSSQGAYIDTGIIANQDTGFEIKFVKLDNLSGSTYRSLFGCRYGTNNGAFALTLDSASGRQGTLYYRNTSASAELINSNTEIQVVSLKNNVYTAPDGTTKTLTISDFSTPRSVKLFCWDSGSSEALARFGAVRLYEFKLFDNAKVLRNYRPCYRKTDEKIGLYDAVGKMFYTNEGTGSFTKGPDVK